MGYLRERTRCYNFLSIALTEDQKTTLDSELENTITASSSHSKSPGGSISPWGWRVNHLTDSFLVNFTVPHCPSIEPFIVKERGENVLYSRFTSGFLDDRLDQSSMNKTRFQKVALVFSRSL